MAFLYMITHKKSGKTYIGWTSQPLRNRWLKHLSDSRSGGKTYFHAALRKYGEGAFDWEVIKHLDSPEEAKQEEIYWIASLRSFGIKLYNLTEGGDGAAGATRSPETREKMGAAKLGSNNPNYGKVYSQEEKDKLSECQRGNKGFWFGKIKEQNPFFGKSHTKENIKLMTGENNVSAKLTWSDVAEIRLLLSKGVSGAKISKQFGIGTTTVTRIKLNQSWKI